MRRVIQGIVDFFNGKEICIECANELPRVKWFSKRCPPCHQEYQRDMDDFKNRKAI